MILVHLAVERRLHLLRVGFDLPGFPELFEFFKAVEAGADRAEVGERAAEPALGDVVHAAALGFFFDGVAGLPLGADEQNVLAAGDGVAATSCLAREQTLDGLLHIDDVNHVALAVDVRLHLRIPARDAVAEVDARVHERFDEFGLIRCHDTLTPKSR